MNINIGSKTTTVNQLAISTKKRGLFLCCLPLFNYCFAQDTTYNHPSISPVSYISTGLKNSPPKKRLWLVAGTHAAVWAGSYIALNQAWYADYPKQSFHFFNDRKEWNQMDKLGHMWTAYQLSRGSKELWRWTGLPAKTSVWLGGASAVAYQSVIEIQDGFSAEWGFSWGDMEANVVGAAAFVAQELTWGKQRVQIKFSYWPYSYPSDLVARRNQLFGKGPAEKILKDYNAQIYWLSTNLSSFVTQSRLPKWLNVAAGYSSDLMLGGTENKWIANGVEYNRTHIVRMRRFYLAPDVDLTQIKTHNKLLRGLFFAVNMIKFPTPALEINARGKLKLHAIAF